jgi:VWFA-related protein
VRPRASRPGLLGLAFVSAFAPPAVLPAQPPAPTFAAGVEVVYVDAFVTRGGKPVVGLTASSFELKDNGAPQAVALVAVEELPIVALLVFDTSGSVEGPKLAALRSASEAFLAGLRPDDQLGLVSFSHEVRYLAEPTSDRPTVRRALESMRARGGTAMWDALHAGLTLLPTRARSLVVLFSDGEDNMSWLEERHVRVEAERSNAVIHVVGVRRVKALRPPRPRGTAEASEPDHERALRQTAEATGGRFWTSDSPARLQEAFAAIVAAMNTRYLLRYEPSSRSAGGWHRIELRLRGAKGDIRARKGYFRAPARNQ